MGGGGGGLEGYEEGERWGGGVEIGGKEARRDEAEVGKGRETEREREKD